MSRVCHHVRVGHFDDETAIEPLGSGGWQAVLGHRWNIGASANGGFALSPVLRALHTIAGHADPISVTTQFLRPVNVDTGVLEVAEIQAEVVRSGRTTSVARGSLLIDGRERLIVSATFGELGPDVADHYEIPLAAPAIPPPDECVDRRDLDQGVELPILDRLDVRIHPDRVAAGGSADAVIEGWIRFRDRCDPTTMALPLFSDAFPPSLYPKFGRIGWVPSIELTVHARRRPAPGWIQARFECDDLIGGRMIETGALWDSQGRLVARSRQLGLLLTR